MSNKIGRPIKIEPIEKTCIYCDKLKIIHEFGLEATKNNPNRRRNECKKCRTQQRKIHNQKTNYYKKYYMSMGAEQKEKYIQQKSEQNQKRFKTNPQALINKKQYDKSDRGIYTRYKNDCNRRGRKKRGIQMLLNFEEFSKIINQPCVYCGMISRGIDRIHSEKNYTLMNSAPCCKICNQMKNSLSTQEFIQHIKQILANINEKL